MQRWLIGCVLGLIGCIPELETPDEHKPTGDPWSCPENNWNRAQPPESLEAQGFYPDQIVPDFTLADQNEDTVCMWQFHGLVTVVDISTMWCQPCQDLAAHTQETQDDYASDGFMYVTVLPQNLEGAAPGPEDLDLWASTYAIQGAPVVSDPDKGYSASAVPDGQYPVVLVTDRNLNVRNRMVGPTDAELRAAVEDVLAEDP